jgi:ABC-type transport system involved in cytochrome c biogenesis permease subunit
VQGITLFCFTASYTLALALEAWHLYRPRPVFRLLGLGASAAGLLAHTLYLAVQPLAWPAGWLLVLAWVLAVFHLLGSVHHRRLEWGVFVLPLVLGLVGLSALFGPPPEGSSSFRAHDLFSASDERLWGRVHAVVLLLASVGICVGFLAGLMYLVQSWRLRAKLPPGKGLRLLSLERLEAMNRRAIIWAFPLLTVGMLLGVVLMFHPNKPAVGWSDPQVLGTGILWLVFAVLLYLRAGRHLRGRQVALWSIAAFALLVCCMALFHPVGHGGTP